MYHEKLRRRIIASSEVHEERMSICKSCEHYKAMLKTCGICFCFLPAKTKLASQSCPLDPPKWSKNLHNATVEDMENGEPLGGE